MKAFEISGMFRKKLRNEVIGIAFIDRTDDSPLMNIVESVLHVYEGCYWVIQCVAMPPVTVRTQNTKEVCKNEIKSVWVNVSLMVCDNITFYLCDRLNTIYGN